MSQPEIIKTVPVDRLTRKASACHSLEFGRALCAHFGLPADKVDSNMTMYIGSDELFGVSIRLNLTPDDLAGIAAHMDVALRKG